MYLIPPLVFKARHPHNTILILFMHVHVHVHVHVLIIIYMYIVHVDISEQALGTLQLSLGLVIEDNPSI